MMKAFNEILHMIQQHEVIIIHRHMRPDPDALGSQCGLASILEASFPDKKIYKVGSTVEDLTYLGVMDEIEDSLYENALVIVTDTANTPRISDPRYSLGDKLVKIDHHPNEDPYGDVYYVDTNASSTSEIIVDFCRRLPDQLQMTDEAARVLYAGIVGDTGRFLYPATTVHTLETAAFLRRYDFDVSKISRKLDEMSYGAALLSAYVYQNLTIDENGAAMVVISQHELNKLELDDSNTAGVVSIPGKIDQVLAWAIFVEQPEGYYRVRLRSKGPTINQLAKEYHGGGHPLASGANAKNQTDVESLYNKLQILCKDYQ